jgi:hypothetical protein
MDPIRLLAIACIGASGERSLPKLMVSALVAQRLSPRLIEAEAAELAALEGERNEAAVRVANALADGAEEERCGRLVRRLGSQTVNYGMLYDLGRRSSTLGLITAMLDTSGGFA